MYSLAPVQSQVRNRKWQKVRELAREKLGTHGGMLLL